MILAFVYEVVQVYILPILAGDSLTYTRVDYAINTTPSNALASLIFRSSVISMLHFVPNSFNI